MKSPFAYSSDNKRYHTLNYHLKQLFDHRIFKAVIDAGFTCPNIDGTKGTGGCIYCLSGGAEFTQDAGRSITAQVKQELERVRRKWPQADVIAYFQAHTNTYAPLQKLQKCYQEALAVDGVCGLSIATRADALEEETMDYLVQLSQQTYLTVELGLQTVHDQTARRIRRGHTYAEFLAGYKALKDRGIRVCVHLINGLPGETEEQMLQTARQVGCLEPDAVKLHLLNVLEGTELAQEYRAGLITSMNMQEYIETVCRQLEYFPPQTVIERLTGDGSREKLLAPRWSTNKIAVLAGIDRTLAQWDTFQGKCIR